MSKIAQAFENKVKSSNAFCFLIPADRSIPQNAESSDPRRAAPAETELSFSSLRAGNRRCKGNVRMTRDGGNEVRPEREDVLRIPHRAPVARRRLSTHNFHASEIESKSKN
jgi:hypothetical protein